MFEIYSGELYAQLTAWSLLTCFLVTTPKAFNVCNIKGRIALDLLTAVNAKTGVRMDTAVTRCGVGKISWWILCRTLFNVRSIKIIPLKHNWISQLGGKWTGCIFMVTKERVGCQTKLAKIWFYRYALELCHWLCSDYLLCKMEV